jgi:transposase
MNKYTIRKILNIPEYKVIRTVFVADQEIHIWLEAYQRKKAVCSGCGKVHVTGYHGFSEVVAEDKSISNLRVYLHVKKRRYRCSEDRRIRTEKISWLKKYSRVTKRFAGQVNRLTAITTNQEAGWYLGLDDEVVYRIDREMLAQQAAELLNPTPAALNISVDEVSYRKYHRYLTNVIDVDEKLVIWNAKGRKAEVLDHYYDDIGKAKCKQIQSVALDGARTYISSTKRHAINALIVYDKFHLVQKLNQTVDMVRKLELRRARENKDQELVELTSCRQRFILLKNKSNLTQRQASYLQTLCEINEPIYQAMLLKESFLQIYSYQKVEDAQHHLEGWITAASNSSLQVFQALAQSFTDKMQYIINWFKIKISSAISEGFNNKIKRLKRMAYGYKDIDYFMLKIHQHCGLLNPRRAT